MESKNNSKYLKEKTYYINNNFCNYCSCINSYSCDYCQCRCHKDKFKDNFNPVINEFIGEFDLPVNKALFKMSEKAYTVAKSRAKEQ